MRSSVGGIAFRLSSSLVVLVQDSTRGGYRTGGDDDLGDRPCLLRQQIHTALVGFQHCDHVAALDVVAGSHEPLHDQSIGEPVAELRDEDVDWIAQPHISSTVLTMSETPT